jgi:hypothetical protein
MSVTTHNFVYLFDIQLIEINIFSFGVVFSSEVDCIAHFKAERNKIGVTCKCKTLIFSGLKAD